MARKDAGKSRAKNIREMLFYLKKNYSPHNEDHSFSFEEMSNYLKTYSKSIIEVKNMTLKNKVLFAGWLSTAAKVFIDAIKCVEKIYLIDLKIGL